MTDFASMDFATLSAQKDGAKKHFYLMKKFGDALRNAGLTNEVMRYMSCEELAARIREMRIA